MRNARYHYTKCPTECTAISGSCVDKIIINTVLLGFILASHIVICNSDTTTTSNTSERSNAKTSNTSTVS